MFDLFVFNFYLVLKVIAPVVASVTQKSLLNAESLASLFCAAKIAAFISATRAYLSIITAGVVPGIVVTFLGREGKTETGINPHHCQGPRGIP